MLIRLPANAQLLVDGTKTRQTGEVRTFVTPPLEAGKTFFYTLKATWNEQGKEVVREREITVMAGRETAVDLRRAEMPKMTRPGQMEVQKSDEMMPKPGDNPIGNANREPDVIFVPTPQEVVDKMLELADVKKDDIVYDLGCGDGRIVVTAAKKYGAKAVGIDIDPQRVKESLANVKQNQVEDLVTINKGDLFALDLSEATVVTLLPDSEAQRPAVARSWKSSSPGSRIVSTTSTCKAW